MRHDKRTRAPRQLLFEWRDALDESALPHGTRHVALALSTWMNMEGGSAYPGNKRLARRVGIHPRNAERHVARLLADGWLHIAVPGGGRGRATEYQAALPGDNSRNPGASATPPPITSHTSPTRDLESSPHEDSERAFTPEDDPTVALKEAPETNGRVDALKRRCLEHFTAKGIARDDCVRVIDQLRGENIADELIDVALGQCENADARLLAYLVKVTRAFYRQRTGQGPA